MTHDDALQRTEIVISPTVRDAGNDDPHAMVVSVESVTSTKSTQRVTGQMCVRLDGKLAADIDAYRARLERDECLELKRSDTIRRLIRIGLKQVGTR